MHNELTRQDLKMMREELDYRRITLRPKLLEAVKEARAFGDLSENFEYKAAKQEKNRNESRIRFLENMIKTAKVFDDTSGADQVGLYDKVTVYMEDDDETEVYQIVTTMRQDVLKGLISKESPVGRSLLGKRVGDRVHIQVNENYGYDAVIRSIEKGEDTGEIPLNRYEAVFRRRGSCGSFGTCPGRRVSFWVPRKKPKRHQGDAQNGRTRPYSRPPGPHLQGLSL